VRWQARTGETFASRGQKMIYHGPLKPLENLLLRTPLVPWSYAASQAYFDGFWYPFHRPSARDRVSVHFLGTALYRVRQRAGHHPALYEPKTVAAGVLGTAASALALWWLLSRGKRKRS